MTTNPDAPPTAVLPYGPGNRWTFSSMNGELTQTYELALQYDIDGSDLSDGYTPDEITAPDLWALWVEKYADARHQRNPNRYQRGEVRIAWTVVAPGHGIFGAAPHGNAVDDFLAHHTHPVHEVTGERINWLRLPVLDRQWNTTKAHRGGFIQQVTGWKPSPLQPTMDVRQLGAAAGLYVPPL
ncbi:hypothetical protein [Streptomyces sp. NBC_01422]|uniref:hypothetical protein n=1 Tax=Streptomyces sp. NBC_01422 TaxID=2903859 RepID=UPI002E29F3B7|nr:hypothetical protein [Streptomyces sp. NBC_01422]